MAIELNQESAALQSAPFTYLRGVTPANTNLPSGVCRGIYVGGAGNLTVILEDDTSAVTLTGVVAGQVYPLRAIQVTSATTATGIVAGY